MICKDCEHCKCRAPSAYGYKSAFYCNHPDQQYIEDFYKKNRVRNEFRFISMGICSVPDIKSSPRWCPLKKK